LGNRRRLVAVLIPSFPKMEKKKKKKKKIFDWFLSPLPSSHSSPFVSPLPSSLHPFVSSPLRLSTPSVAQRLQSSTPSVNDATDKPHPTKVSLSGRERSPILTWPSRILDPTPLPYKLSVQHHTHEHAVIAVYLQVWVNQLAPRTSLWASSRFFVCRTHDAAIHPPMSLSIPVLVGC
jgi:hypothetical protein